MKINIKQELRTYNNKPIYLNADSQVPITLGNACAEVLASPTVQKPGKEVAADDMYKNFKLAQKIENCTEDELDLLPEEIVRIKDKLANVCNEVLIGPVYELLNG